MTMLALALVGKKTPYIFHKHYHANTPIKKLIKTVTFGQKKKLKRRFTVVQKQKKKNLD